MSRAASPEVVFALSKAEAVFQSDKMRTKRVFNSDWLLYPIFGKINTHTIPDFLRRESLLIIKQWANSRGLEWGTYCTHTHTHIIARKELHPHPAHTSYTPPTHMSIHTCATNNMHTTNEPVLLSAEVQLISTHIDTHTLQWSAPSLRQGNESVPLCFPQCVCVCVCVHFNVCMLCVRVSMWMWSGPVILQAAKRKPTSTAIHHTLGIDLPSEGRNGMACLASPLLTLPHPSSGLLLLTSSCIYLPKLLVDCTLH